MADTTDRPLASAPEALIAGAVEQAASALAAPGDWLTGAQRLEVWAEARDARTNELDRARREAISPNAVDGAHGSGDTLVAEAVEVVHRVASDPGRLSRTWATAIIDELGEETYTELVGVTAIATTLDTFSHAALGEEATIPVDSDDGEPSRVRPDEVGDVGAWVSQSTRVGAANVSRSLSLVPRTAGPWIGLVQAMYSRGEQFLQLEWQRALSRPQVELVAARTTAELQCFY